MSKLNYEKLTNQKKLKYLQLAFFNNPGHMNLTRTKKSLNPKNSKNNTFQNFYYSDIFIISLTNTFQLIFHIF